ncbi:MAG: hypothetical protein E7304_12855 [Butyrivibrio sp.]|uniref:hypothetical protein n=1 Tax=Butyrivibrio sp. TaxID=28121 RepID=UPI001ECA6F6D|nr:hypothetical protein [Butyrivibrio sp.]MBE5842278.1 hypothetical protein [Butyrivibrio sp.]
MKKKILSLILATAMAASVLTACGDKTSEESTSEVQTVVGSDAKDTSEVAEDKGGDAPVSTEAEASSDTEAFIESLNVVENNVYGIDFSAENIDNPPATFDTYNDVITHLIHDSMLNGTNNVFFGKNYSSTSDLMNDVFAKTSVASYFTELDNGTVDATTIANVIDAVAETEGTSVYMIAIESDDISTIMVYYENGNAYGITNITTAEDGTISFDWSTHSQQCIDNGGLVVRAYKIHLTDGVVDSVEAD